MCLRRFAARALVAVVVLLAVASGAFYLFLRRSLPIVDGTVTLPAISGPIDIIRDADAIPHVYASTKLDALFGLGYLHAQDRLWQMEIQRRIGFGRLSEIFGAATIPQDRFLRTVGFGRAARAAWSTMPAWAKTQVNAYTAGVNAFVASASSSRLPPEFTLLRFKPEPWDGADVVVWVKMMAWDLSANYNLELVRHDLVNRVGVERMQQLMPPYPVNGLNIVPTTATERKQAGRHPVPGADAPAASAPHSAWAAAFNEALSGGEPSVRRLLRGSLVEGLGSNNWVVDGTRTASGKPLLANDPHLGTRIPSTWYLAHVSAGEFEMIGATLPGTPAVALGRNRFIAWGATNVAADVEDLYLERLDAAGGSAEFRGAFEPLTIVPEVITVKGGDPVHFDVRLTRHGPLVSDAINVVNATARRRAKPAPVQPLALRWTGLDADDTTLESFLALNDARNWNDFVSALSRFVVPSQNFVYADVSGHIGYYAPGRIPIRAQGDGSRPMPGWTGEFEWTGHVPFERLPHLADPPEHFIVTANNRPAGPDYPFHLGLDWPEPYRAERIVSLVAGHRSVGPDDFARFQADTVSLHAKALLPLMIQRVVPETDLDRQVLDLLRRWDFDARADSVPAALFEAWFLQLAPAIAGDELGLATTDSYQGRFSFVTRFLQSVLASHQTVGQATDTSPSTWCDDVRTTDRRETCGHTVTQALHLATEELKKRLGSDPVRWRWDAVHAAVFPHQGLDAVALLRPLLSRSVPTGGDWSTINVGPVDADVPYEQHSISGYRQIIDLSAANDSRFIDAVGESGHQLSKHYDDFLPDWRAVRYRPMRMNRQDIERGAIGKLQLVPDK